jgi:hypothetical protein
VPSEQFRRSLGRSGRVWRGCLDLAIEREGLLVGHIQARTSPKQTLPPGVFEALGFRLEGIMRAFGAASDGTRYDGAMYAVIRARMDRSTRLRLQHFVVC